MWLQTNEPLMKSSRKESEWDESISMNKEALMLESINDVTGYLQAFGGALAHKIQTEAEPLFQPGDDWHPRMKSLLRTPFQAQADSIQAAVEPLKRQDRGMG